MNVEEAEAIILHNVEATATISTEEWAMLSHNSFLRDYVEAVMEATRLDNLPPLKPDHINLDDTELI